MPINCDHRYSRNKGRYGHDYADARLRAELSLQSNPTNRKYAIAVHLAKAIQERRQDDQHLLAKSFHENVDRWKDETAHLSSITKALAHPSYLRIIGLANKSTDHSIERLLLHELEAEPDHWFAALTAITGEDPVKPEDDFDGAVNAWLQWGKTRGII